LQRQLIKSALTTINTVVVVVRQTVAGEKAVYQFTRRDQPGGGDFGRAEDFRPFGIGYNRTRSVANIVFAKV